MPIYEYECNVCNKRTERLQKISDPPLEKCPECGGAVSKLISSAGLHFKGTGWYVTDYAKKKGESPEKNKKSEASKKEGNTSKKENTTNKPSTGSKE